MATKRNAWRNLIDGLGNLEEAKEGFRRGVQPASEDARSVLFKYRDERGLDEPPQIAEVASRSGIGGNLREIFSTQSPGTNPLSNLGYSDEMLRARIENGQSIAGDPLIFDNELGIALEAKRRKIQEELSNADFGEVFDPNQVELNDKEYRTAVGKAADKARKTIKNQSLLKKIGYSLGAAVGDVAEDRSRSLYWLLNAPQAVTSVAADLAVSKSNPNLRTKRNFYAADFVDAESAGLLRKVGGAPLDDRKLKRALEEDPDILHKISVKLGDSVGFDTELSQYINPDNYKEAAPGVRRGYDQELKQPVFQQRRLGSNIIGLAGLGGVALATNAGLGLLGTESTGVPGIGRREGYQAAAPDELDPRKTNDVLQEIATRYILSRDGNLLNKSDFLLERVDVTPGEYSAYDAYKYNKELDVNPFDGDFNLGILKGTDSGIHGPEVQLLGQTLSLNEAGIPIGGALVGTALGGLLPNVRQIRLRRNRPSWDNSRAGIIHKIMGSIPEVARKEYDGKKDLKNPLIKEGTRVDKFTKQLEDFFLEDNKVTGRRDMNVPRNAAVMAAGSGLGLLGGTLLGVNAEEQRREENFRRNNPGIDYETYRANAKKLLDQKYEQIAANPNREQEQKVSKVGVNKRAQQEALQMRALQQQTLIDQIVDKDRRIEAGKAMVEQERALARANAIEQEISRRHQSQEEEQPMTISF